MTWLDSNWLYRKVITIDQTKIDADLTDFPILVKLNASNFDFSKARSDGYDIRFTTSDGTTLLKYERERHDQPNQLAEYWVKVPSVSSTVDTEICIYYGYTSATEGADPTNVWDSNFVAVYHLKESGNGTLGEYKDSTINANHGRGGNGVAGRIPIQVDGKIAKGQDFDGTNDFINTPDANSLDISIGLTLEAWVYYEGKASSYQNYATVVSKIKNGGIADPYTVYNIRLDNLTNGNQKVGGNISTGIAGSLKTVYSADALPLNTWKLLTFTYDQVNMKVYFDDSLNGTPSAQSITIGNSTDGLFMGRENSTTNNNIWNGKIDEIRVSNIARSLEYIKATYNSENNTLVTYGSEQLNTDFLGTDTITLSDEIELNLSLEKIQESDTIILSDNVHIAPSIAKEETDTLGITDEIQLTEIKKQQEEDTLILSDEIELNVSLEKEILTDSLSLSDVILLELQETRDLLNDFRSAKQAIIDINNKFSFCKRVFSNLVNIIFTANRILEDISNKFNSKRQEIYNIKNDIRTLLSFQIPGDAGVQSLGKSYIKIYIDSIEQTDVDVDSITISKSLNASHTAVFELGRAYDSTKPDLEAEVEIKYHIWTLYTGYITQIAPSDNPESIRIQCQDKYWKNNQDKVYFNVGHKPQDNLEVYYNTITEGLSVCGVSFGIGSFIPQTIGLFGSNKSDAISNLVGQSGNFSWYYKVDGTPRLWSAGIGDIINIEEQEIGKNLGLYQVLSHQIREDVESIVNQYRVQMGQKVIRRFNSSGGTKKFATYEYHNVQVFPQPDWNASYEVLAIDSGTGFGFDSHKPEDNALYQDVFRKYKMPFLNKELEEWSDRDDPEVTINLPFGMDWKCNIPVITVGNFGFIESRPIREGFTIDYKNQTLIFNQPLYLYKTNEYGELTEIRAPYINLWIWKKKYYSDTDNPSQNPQTDIANPLMFFTSKMGSYSKTIMENLNLTNLSIQIGGRYKDNEGHWNFIPSWDDTAFASDYANWQLSQNCDVKKSGTIEITLDAFCYYGIELANRIMINNILEEPLNIQSITLNISSFTASIQLQNGRYFVRTVSIQSRGE